MQTATQQSKETEQTKVEKEPQRALITYRTKEFKADAKWSLWFQRIIESATDTADALKKFYDGWIWPAMTGAIEIKSVAWPDKD